MEIETIAQRYGALPSDVRRAPASLIRHYRLIARIENADAVGFMDDGSDE